MMVPQKEVVPQTVMVPVTQMVETVTMLEVPKYSCITSNELQKMDADMLSPGQTIKFYNLQERPELNGQAGVLETYDSENRGWVTSLINGGGRVIVRPENIL